MSSEPVLQVRNLRAFIGTRFGVVRAVEDVSIEIDRAQALGVVGESGSGKSVMARAIMGLMPPRSGCSGEVVFQGRDILALSKKEQEAIWGKQIAMVFQDPGRSLNPVVRVERQLTEGMRRHFGVSRSEAASRALDLLREVGVPDPERRLRNYPHELSGGMRQRVMIAIALACEPDLLIADEPTTALDVTIQRQILDLLRTVQRDRGISMMLISHDLAVVAGRTDRVAVMYAGRLAEIGVDPAGVRRATAPLHPRAARRDPAARSRAARAAAADPGLAAGSDRPAGGLPVRARCAVVDDDCHDPGPPMTPVDSGSVDQGSARTTRSPACTRCPHRALLTGGDLVGR